MTLEQYKSLTEEEIGIIWFCVNKVHPPILRNLELNPEDLVCIKHNYIIEKMKYSRKHIKEEYLPLFDGLIEKLSVA